MSSASTLFIQTQIQSEQLPWDLEEKILSLIPTKSLHRFRSVCKRWNALLNDKRFINNHLARVRPQFILLAESKICSVDVNLDGPSIEVHNLPSDIPGYVRSMPMTVEYCDGLIMYATYMGTGICNPWLRQMKWISSKEPFHCFNGMGYDNSRPDSHYNIFTSEQFNNTILKANITEFGSDAWKSYEFACDNWMAYHNSRPNNHYKIIDSDQTNNTTLKANITELGSGPWLAYEFSTSKWNLAMSYYSVSLNGTLYWVAFNRELKKHFIQSFDFTTKRFKPYCILPSKNAGPYDARSLAVYRGDRFSFLEQNSGTRNIEIWVTKEKIQNKDGEAVEWMKLMNVSIPEWSSLEVSYYPPSYFIDEEKSLSLVFCCYNKEGKAFIYIAKGDKFHEIRIDELVEDQPRHRTYFPSLVPVPTFRLSNRGKIQQVESRFRLPRGVQAINGIGGNEWDDGFFDDVKNIYVRLNPFRAVVFVKFDYSKDNEIVAGAGHGNAADIPDHGVPIADDDYIEAVEGTYTESHITSIRFRMHKRNMSFFYGRFSGVPFMFGGGVGSKVIGFYGRSSDGHLTALGAHLSSSV